MHQKLVIKEHRRARACVASRSETTAEKTVDARIDARTVDSSR